MKDEWEANVVLGTSLIKSAEPSHYSTGKITSKLKCYPSTHLKRNLSEPLSQLKYF